MTPSLRIALRFLTHRKRALLLCLSGVVFGVAIFICTEAQTQGFARQFIDSTIGSNRALMIRSRFRPRYEPLMVSSKNSNRGRRSYFEGIATRVYSHARVAQTLLQRPFGASMIIYKLRDPDRAPALASHFEKLFQHEADSWQQREESTLQLFLTLRMSVAITVSLIILLAGFGIFNVLTMSVLAKIKEIAILRSMGYRRIDISAIFLWQGALIAVAGSIFGCLLGALMTWGVSHIPIRIRGLLYTDYFLVTWDWRQYVFATLLAILAVFIASYVPARRAAELPPVVTLRGSSV
jgi:ABC-type lipoprotein release transport system permease subunit